MWLAHTGFVAQYIYAGHTRGSGMQIGFEMVEAR